MVIERLEAHNHPFPHEHLRYEGAGHMIVMPGAEPEAHEMDHLKVGGCKDANEFANEDAWRKVLDFLRKAVSVGNGKGSGK